MERTPENIREFREKAAECIGEAVNALLNIINLCTEEGYDSDDGEYMGWFDYLLPEYDGETNAYPFSLSFDEQIAEMIAWKDSIIDAIENDEMR